MTFSKEDIEILNNHVSSIDDDIYVIYNLPPEVVAVLFAYVSRSPASFRKNLLKLIKSKELDMGDLITSFKNKGLDYDQAKEKAKQFHERWVVGYGHSSVAEHAVASIAMENVSILATKVIEDNRLASYTEKSTRYQVFDRNTYYKPKNLKGEAKEIYEKTCNMLFDTYCDIMPKMVEYMKKKHPKKEGENDRLYESVTKARACDVARYLLPASTLTNLGMTVNARSIEYGVTKMLSSPLSEMKAIGEGVRRETTKVIPTLIKYARENEYMEQTNKVMEKLAHHDIKPLKREGHDNVILVHHDPEADNKLVASILYRYSDHKYEDIFHKVEHMTRTEKEEVLDEYLKRMGKHDRPMRELEHVNYTFDILVDYGAFRDIQRHRMCTQTNQDLTTKHGYDIPPEIKDAGFEKDFVKCMEAADNVFKTMSKEYPKEAQYVVPLAYKKRVLISMNLRDLYNFVKLRSGPEGHISYRKIAWDMYDATKNATPLVARHMKVDKTIGPSR